MFSTVGDIIDIIDSLTYKTFFLFCLEGETPKEASKAFKVIGGSCSAASVAKLKVDFVTALLTDPIIQSIYCVQSTENCVVKNVRVTCSANRKRSTGSTGNEAHISFDFYVQDTQPSSDQNAEITKINKIITTMGHLGAQVCVTYAYRPYSVVYYQYKQI